MRKIAVFAVAIAVVTALTVNTPTVKAEQIAETTPAPVTVKVVEGDYLSKIAEAHGTTWKRIFDANESIKNPDIINPGQELRIPTADEQLPERLLPQPVAVVAAPAPAAPAPAPAPVYSAAPKAAYQAPAPAPAPASYPVSTNAAKAFIYNKESGNNPNATNPIGCYGIGQDCNGVLRAQCGANYACQDAYFDGYAERRYGGWDGAYAFWQANGWW